MSASSNHSSGDEDTPFFRLFNSFLQTAPEEPLFSQPLHDFDSDDDGSDDHSGDDNQSDDHSGESDDDDSLSDRTPSDQSGSSSESDDGDAAAAKRHDIANLLDRLLNPRPTAADYLMEYRYYYHLLRHQEQLESAAKPSRFIIPEMPLLAAITDDDDIDDAELVLGNNNRDESLHDNQADNQAESALDDSQDESALDDNQDESALDDNQDESALDDNQDESLDDNDNQVLDDSNLDECVLIGDEQPSVDRLGSDKEEWLVQVLRPEVDSLLAGAMLLPFIVHDLDIGDDGAGLTTEQRLLFNAKLVHMARRLEFSFRRYSKRLLRMQRRWRWRTVPLPPTTSSAFRRFVIARAMYIHHTLKRRRIYPTVLMRNPSGGVCAAACALCGQSTFPRGRLFDIVCHLELVHRVRVRSWDHLLDCLALLPALPAHIAADQFIYNQSRVSMLPIVRIVVPNIPIRTRDPTPIWAAAFAAGFHPAAIQRAIRRYEQIVPPPPDQTAPPCEFTAPPDAQPAHPTPPVRQSAQFNSSALFDRPSQTDQVDDLLAQFDRTLSLSQLTSQTSNSIE